MTATQAVAASGTGEKQRILVIKLGALGDFVLALGPFAAIRQAHAAADVTLLTTAPFAELAHLSGLFDDVWIDDRPSLLAPRRWLRLRRQLRDGRFDRVYDLQTADRTGWYFTLMGPDRPEWSGIARGCSHPHDDPARDSMHTLDRQAAQLSAAGIDRVPPPDLSWMDGDIARFGLEQNFALLVPGGAPHRPRKRWPAPQFAVLGRHLAEMGVQTAIIGGDGERALAAEIADGLPSAANLAGNTQLVDIAALARAAACAVGNDTGPMHLIAAAGCPSLVVFSDASDPVLTAPRGANVSVLQRANLADLPVAEVAAALRLR